MMSSLEDFYRDRHVFITGGSGFMGKVLVEKLLRSCANLASIYLLIRPKRGKSSKERIQEIVNLPIFDNLREHFPERLEKIHAIAGDMLEAHLGISQADMQLLAQHVSIVFHSAATVRFDEALKLSVEMNMLGTQKVIALCKKLSKLEACVHVSTAYCNCDREKVVEMIYPTPLHPKQVLDALDWMSEDVIDQLTPSLIRPRPNTYTYTKALAENLLYEESPNLPIAIVRPSIVGASWKEPFSGWVDNFNGPTGLLAAIGKGVLRIMEGNFNGTADIVPVDLATNLMIAAAWKTAVEKSKDIRVYNCTTGQINKLTWGMVERSSYTYFMKHPLDNIYRIPNPRFTTSKLWRQVNIWFDHYLPAWIMDLVLGVVGKKPILTKFQNRLWKSVNTLEYFTAREWYFTNDNMINLYKDLNETDKTLFNFDMKSINWPEYMENYCIGTKKYALKEDMSGIGKARAAVRKLQHWHRIYNVVIAVAVWRLLLVRFTVVKKLWHFILNFTMRIMKNLPTAFGS